MDGARWHKTCDSLCGSDFVTHLAQQATSDRGGSMLGEHRAVQIPGWVRQGGADGVEPV